MVCLFVFHHKHFHPDNLHFFRIWKKIHPEGCSVSKSPNTYFSFILCNLIDHLLDIPAASTCTILTENTFGKNTHRVDVEVLLKDCFATSEQQSGSELQKIDLNEARCWAPVTQMWNWCSAAVCNLEAARLSAESAITKWKQRGDKKAGG